MTQTHLRVSGIFGDVKLAENFLQDMKKKNWCEQGIFRNGRVVSIITKDINCRDMFRQCLEGAAATVRD